MVCIIIIIIIFINIFIIFMLFIITMMIFMGRLGSGCYMVSVLTGRFLCGTKHGFFCYR